MNKIPVFVFGLLLAAPVMTMDARTQTAADREAVRQTLLDYVEGIYNVQPERLERSVHPDIIKRGYYRENPAAEFRFVPMTRDQLITFAADWNKDKKRPIDTYPKEVIVYEVVDQTASGKVIAMWGIDYIHLAKHDGRWKIVNVLWQSPPK
ncbi:MAG TPA: nuclear transport factor 2 family protein [Vicinamibacterales bacterium]|nr:nuclear transport factor 2 family protein [Vicinamibacterales bacterium]